MTKGREKQFRKLIAWSLIIAIGLASVFVAPKKAKAATFQMQTGYYVGTGASLAITGVGFQPQLVIIKADTTAGVGGVWKSTTMTASNSAYFTATANDANTMITFNSDGFTLSSAANVNTVNVVWKWIAFAGSDCSASGTFCVGSYTGNGGASQEISSVGFTPDMIWTKGSSTTAATWRSSSMADNVGQYFTATTQNTTGALFTTLDSDGFTVGLTNNANTIVYQYVAFKKVSTAMNVGTYSGNGTSQSISSMGFTPDWVFVKNANAATAVAPVFNLTESFGNYSSLFTDAAVATTHITSLDSDGFSVGASSNANGSGNTLFWASFGGATNPSGSGTFQMADGSYTGTGVAQSITGLSFKPDLVIIKQSNDASPQHSVFRTKLMPGDSTAYLPGTYVNFTGGITSLNADGFTLGTSLTTNVSGDTYYWTAFGNAFDPFDSSGAADFAVGAYYGNGIDSRNITRVPFQPDLVAVKRNGATTGAWRSSQNSGDQSAFFAATAETTNIIQTFNADGFQIGTAANTNTAANVYWWFAFKSGTNFIVNTYSGTGSSQNITTVGFQPDLLWVKRTTAINGVFRPSSLAGDSTQYFNNVNNISDRITGFLPNGFSVGGSQTETNTSGGNYRYAAWGGQRLITSLTTDKGDYPTSGETITVDLTAQNNSGKNITNSYLDYVIFIDANSNGQPDAGETYVTNGCAGSGAWASGNYTHETSGFNVSGSGGTNNDEWTCANTNFPQNTTYTLWAKWWDGTSLTYNTKYVTFTSVPTLGEILLIVFVIIVVLIVGRIILNFRRRRYWLFYYLGATFVSTMVMILMLRRFGIDQYLVNAASYHVYLVANRLLHLPLDILSNGRFQLLLPDGGSSILKLGIECSAVIESSILISLLIFLPIFSLRQRMLRAFFGLILTYVINLCRLLIIVLMAYKFGPDYIFLAHALVGRLFFFAAELLLYWWLFTKPMTKAVGDSIERKMPLAVIARSGQALRWRNTYGQAITSLVIVVILATSFSFSNSWQKAFISQKPGEKQVMGEEIIPVRIEKVKPGQIRTHNLVVFVQEQINLKVVEGKESLMIEIYLNGVFQNRTIIKPEQPNLPILEASAFVQSIKVRAGDVVVFRFKNLGNQSSNYLIEISQ